MSFLRGDVVICSIGGMNGKPRPFVVIQTNVLNENLPTTLVAPFTSEVRIEREDFRLIMRPSSSNSLGQVSQVMLDRIIVVSNQDIAKKIGELNKKELQELNQLLAFVVGL